MKRFYTVAALFMIICSGVPLTGCSARPAAGVRVASTPPDAVDRLRSDLGRIFDDVNFENAFWGVEVASLDNGQILYERNSTRLFMPASNNKVVTAAAALTRLGPDFRFQTPIMTEGEISDGVLRGSLVVVGSGDPSTAARFNGGDPFAVFKEWAGILKQKGILRIEGKIVGDDGAFAEPPLGHGWSWDDLAYGYAAPVTALQFNENLLTLEVSPGMNPGAAASVAIRPVSDFLQYESSVTTSPAGTKADIRIAAGSGDKVTITGQVPFRGEPLSQRVAVRSPASLYVATLRATLEQQGVAVSGGTSVVRNSDRSKLRLLWTHASPPLSEILKPLLKMSQNLYAETVARVLGISFADEGSFETGREATAQVLTKMGIERGTYAYEDGSGLSRLNLVSPDVMVRIFRYMYRQPCFPQFYEALPVAGVDGTIEGRMKGTRAENNVRAKTGTQTYVRSLSGYVRTADGETLAFSMIANNFLASSESSDYVQDTAAQRLAAFTRKP